MAFFETKFPPPPTDLKLEGGVIRWIRPSQGDQGPEIFYPDRPHRPLFNRVDFMMGPNGVFSQTLDKSKYEISFTNETEESVTLNIKKK